MSQPHFLSDDEKHQLVTLVHEIESGTSGEIVTVIAGASDAYRYIPLLLASLAALSVPGVYFMVDAIQSGGWYLPETAHTVLARIYLVQGLVFLGLGALFQIDTLRLWLIPASIKRRRAQRHAREQFFVQGVHQTQARNGVLIFVSVAEHYVEIIADSGLATRADESVWQSSVDDFVGLVKDGQVYEGFVRAIEHCRDVLWEHFPHEHGRPNERPDKLIEI